ncbi:hypothetical protein HP567_010020 [Brevibacillus sp. M2.1A]|nr:MULTISPECIES: hypothetical protein [Brevibacillus]MCC8434878.1 hypothetical protein [Brevibacillus sp. M2.1A]MCE0450043.1 hypothetical protein [Brevibacillus sp. AF8]UKK97273.1 hypothetical protein FO446_07535 [Brevibacillus brevis]
MQDNLNGQYPYHFVAGSSQYLMPKFIATQPLRNATLTFDLNDVFTPDATDLYYIASSRNEIGADKINGSVITIPNVTLDKGQLIIFDLGSYTMPSAGTYKFFISVDSKHTQEMVLDISNN